jgi:hypothetical protein
MPHSRIEDLRLTAGTITFEASLIHAVDASAEI